MPSSTPKQKRTMAAAAHDPAFAKKLGIPQHVAKDFNRADTGRSYCKGGVVQGVQHYAKMPRPGGPQGH